MAVPVLNNLDFYGNQVVRPVLTEAKVGSKPASPEPGHFYMINGVLYYRTANNTDQPVHENALNSIVSGGVGSLTVQVDSANQQATISIQEATSSLSGLLSTQHFDLLDNATFYPTADTLVVRDNAGGTRFEGIIATEVFVDGAITGNDGYFNNDLAVSGSVTTNAVNGLSSNQDSQDNTYAVSLGYFRTQLENVQSAIASRDFKENVRVALTDNTALTSVAGTYDGVAIANNDAIALVNQTDPVENGVYLVTTSGLVRRSDSASSTVMTSGATYSVSEGTLGGRLIMLTTPAGFTVDADPLSFLVIDDSASAGDGLIKTGKTIHAVGTTDRISVTADAIDIASGYIGQSSITTLGTVTDAIWNAEAIAITYGGTGAATAPEALTNLGAVQEEDVILLGDGSATSFSVPNNLNSPVPEVRGYLLISGSWVRVPDLDVRINATTKAITVYAQQGSNAIGANQLKVVVSGKKYL